MFEHEYHTLTQLAHPCIVRAFDYGHDPNGPFYTMELLEGSDLRVALHESLDAVHEVCSLLRDVASALALIHSRRLVHRDVNPRNIWRSPNKRAKLIDFGTLTPMGTQRHLAGTPPYVPPEALHDQAIDGRTDLYALGALGYFLLTGRHAYPARDFADLNRLWRQRPDAVFVLNPKIPEALSALIMALLSLDLRGRPASAAEVVERLTAVGGLAAEDERPAALAYLSTPKLVGREAQSLRMRKQLLRAVRGRGGSLLLAALPNMGRSRMLASAVLEAKLLGATALHTHAGIADPAPLGVGCTLAEQLLQAMPEAAVIAGDAGRVLAHLSPALFRLLGSPERSELGQGDPTRALGDALFELFDRVSRKHCLLLAVDDVHLADDLSIGVLERLTAIAGERRLMVVTACEQQALVNPGPALRDARRGSASSIERAQKMSSEMISDGLWMLEHWRWLGYAFTGDGIRAELFFRRAEAMVDDDVWHRNGWLFIEAELHALSGDLMRLKQVTRQIGELAGKFRGWRAWHHWAKGELHRLRGELERARGEFE